MATLARIWPELGERSIDSYPNRSRSTPNMRSISTARQADIDGVPARTRRSSCPADLDFDAISGLSNELREKLRRVRPATLGQAARIDGMTPAALALLLASAQAAPAAMPPEPTSRPGATLAVDRSLFHVKHDRLATLVGPRRANGRGPRISSRRARSPRSGRAMSPTAPSSCRSFPTRGAGSTSAAAPAFPVSCSRSSSPKARRARGRTSSRATAGSAPSSGPPPGRPARRPSFIRAGSRRFSRTGPRRSTSSRRGRSRRSPASRPRRPPDRRRRGAAAFLKGGISRGRSTKPLNPGTSIW